MKQLGLGSEEPYLPEGQMGTILYNTLKDLDAPSSAVPGAGVLKSIPGADALNNIPGADALKSLQGSGALKSLFDSGALNSVPGADLLKNSLTESDASETAKRLLLAVALYLNALENDLGRVAMLDSDRATVSMSPRRASAVADALADVEEIIPKLKSAFEDFIEDASGLDSLYSVPSLISGELIYVSLVLWKNE